MCFFKLAWSLLLAIPCVKVLDKVYLENCLPFTAFGVCDELPPAVLLLVLFKVFVPTEPAPFGSYGPVAYF